MAEYLRYFEFGKYFADRRASEFYELSYSDELTARMSVDVRRFLDFDFNLDLSLLDSPQNNKFIGLLPFQGEHIFIQAQTRRENEKDVNSPLGRPFRQYVCVFLGSEEIRSYFQKGIPLYSLLVDITGGEKKGPEDPRLLKDYSALEGKVLKKFPSLIQSETINAVSLDTRKLIGSIGLAPYRQKERIGVFSSKIDFNWVSRLEIIEQTQMLLCQTADFFQQPSKPKSEILSFVSDGNTLRQPPALVQFVENRNIDDGVGQFIDLDKVKFGEFSNLETIRKLKNAIENKNASEILQCLSNIKPLDQVEQEILPISSLNLSSCNLGHIPPQIRYLTGLTYLDLAKNQVQALPPEIGSFPNLEVLDLSNNQISELPSAVSNLKDLKIFNLARNKLTNFPFALCDLQKLESLDLSGNKIEKLPQEILQLTKLQKLGLPDTKSPIPVEILERQDFLHSILTFQDLVLDGKPQPLSEIKMLVVGQGNVGKTSLVRRLIDNTFSPNEIKTEGIDINLWQVDNTEIGERQPQHLRINVWDFGGQEIMHATHQFFLTKRSLYLLVLDSRLTQEENRVEYWLKIIQSFGGNSPVLLIGNKTDQHPLDIDRTGLQKKYSNIVGVIETSASTGTGIEELKTIITKKVNDLPHVRDALPEAWFNVKNLLEKLGRAQNYISQDKYLEICSAGEIRNEENQRLLIGFLHDLGTVLYFQDSPRLGELGILNPQWVTNGVYKILNSHALFQNKGQLHRAMLNDILPKEDYPMSKRLFIVDMMRKFELCYDLDPDQAFLIPDLLPKDEPYTGEWNGALAFQYHYNVLPSSIISRFIVRMNSFIHKTVWRAGVVLKKDGNTALVKADTEDKKIYIWVNGDEPTRRDFLSAIRAEFDAIHKTIIKIEATEKVPVPGHAETEPIPFVMLLQAEREGRNTIPVMADEKLIDVNVRELLNGVRTGEAPAPAPIPIPVPVVAPKPEPAAVPAPQPSLLMKILHWVFVEFPKIVGRIPLDIVGKGKDAADSTTISVGYGIIILILLVVFGYVGVDALITIGKDIWRFFFPVKP